MERNKIIPYNPKLKKLARELRKNGTLSEVLLWREIKSRRLGYQFHRQVPIDQYIVDFYCHELILAIEVDGLTHNFKYDLDQQRQHKLEDLGVHFLRFQEKDVRNNIEGVVFTIKEWIREKEQLRNTPQAPLKRGSRRE
jgi:very-short-patch-repair endonuclease